MLASKIHTLDRDRSSSPLRVHLVCSGRDDKQSVVNDMVISCDNRLLESFAWV
jgi:hypothetical protein